MYKQIGLQGKNLSLYKGEGLNSAKWVSTSQVPNQQPLTWYKAILDAPSADEPVGLDMIHMGKGLAWLNGEEIGRYWPRKASFKEPCVHHCDYRGKFSPNKCSTGCGEPTQKWYHVPRSWFKPSGNVLVIFEEKGGYPTQIKFSKRIFSSFCAHISEDHPSFKTLNEQTEKKATLELKCPVSSSISAIKFVSFGSPTGTCGSFVQGDCHDSKKGLPKQK
jgi:hypothetical protein